MMFIKEKDTSHFSDIDFQLTNYIQDNPKTVSDLKLKELSSMLYVSESAIVRYCKKIGLTGFNELKYQLKNELALKKQNNFKTRVETEIESFKDFIEKISLEKVNKLTGLICSEYPLYIHGSSLSLIPANYLHTVLNTLDRESILVKDIHLINSISRTIQKNSTIIIISSMALNKTYESVFKSAKEKGSNTVLITSNHESSLISQADFSFITEDEKIKYHDIDVNSRIDIITLIQVIIECVYRRLLNSELSH